MALVDETEDVEFDLWPCPLASHCPQLSVWTGNSTGLLLVSSLDSSCGILPGLKKRMENVRCGTRLQLLSGEGVRTGSRLNK